MIFGYVYEIEYALENMKGADVDLRGFHFTSGSVPKQLENQCFAEYRTRLRVLAKNHFKYNIFPFSYTRSVLIAILLAKSFFSS